MNFIYELSVSLAKVNQLFGYKKVKQFVSFVVSLSLSLCGFFMGSLLLLLFLLVLHLL